MKNFQRFLATLALIVMSASPAYAQITILPSAGDTSADECKSLLDVYEVQGSIPNQDTVVADEFAKAKSTYDDLQSTLDEQSKQCKTADPKCDPVAMAKTEYDTNAAKTKKDALFDSLAAATVAKKPVERDKLLGCAIKTGRISLQMIPYFITYFSNFLLSLVGIITVLFLVIGGYQYIRGGLTENKDKGKKTIEHALAGMVVAILAWVIVNLVMGALTS